uniref:Putative transposable element n=1 Tax=Ixodes ricinus TaxID=34613 RepID=A0A6B0UXJ5_IXORI
MSSTSSTAIFASITRVLTVTTADITDINEHLRCVWELENIGITAKKSSTKAHVLLEEFQSKVKYRDGRSEVSLPWNDQVEELNNIKGNAERRLRSLTERVIKNRMFMRDYDTKIREYFVNGFAEKLVNSAEAGISVYYMQQQEVVQQDRRTKNLRVVFDSSS